MHEQPIFLVLISRGELEMYIYWLFIGMNSTDNFKHALNQTILATNFYRQARQGHCALTTEYMSKIMLYLSVLKEIVKGTLRQIISMCIRVIRQTKLCVKPAEIQ